MREIKIYTAGKMNGISYQEQMCWRFELESVIKSRAEYCDGNEKVRIKFLHPPLFYGYHMSAHKSEKEVKEWELNHLAKSDIMIVNLNDINTSTGSHFELSYATAVNNLTNHHIYILGLGEIDETTHPWVVESFIRTEPTIEELAKYVVDYLLI